MRQENRGSIVAAFAALLAVALAVPAGAESKLPIIDTHVHYSRPAWDVYSPAQILDKLDAAGVERAMVSSTPDDGTLALRRSLGARVVPVLRPYRTRADMGDWFASDAVLDYMKGRLARGRYAGIGEFHMSSPGDARTPQMRALIDIVVARGILLHAHASAAVVEALFAVEPRLRIHWAHSGFAPVDRIGAMLDQYENLTADIAIRGGEIGSDGNLNPAWRNLLIRHRDRFMIGSDTYVTSRWDTYGEIIDNHRAWLGKLPADVAKAIAHGNAERAFGITLLKPGN